MVQVSSDVDVRSMKSSKRPDDLIATGTSQIASQGAWWSNRWFIGGAIATACVALGTLFALRAKRSDMASIDSEFES